MKTIDRRGALGALLAAAAAPAAAASFDLREIAAGVFVHSPPVALATRLNAGDICNLGLIVGGDSVAIVDTGGSPAVGRRFRTAIAQLTDKPVRYAVNTHMHPDHMFGNAAFAGDGAIFVGHRNLPRAIAARQAHYLSSVGQQVGAEAMLDMAFIPPTLLIADEAEIDLGGRRLVLKAWPAAHTDNDVTVLDTETATLFTGDLVFIGHTPVLDGNLKGWLRVMDELAAIPARQMVAGHGGAPAPWPAAARAQDRYLNRLADDVRQLVKQGATISQAIDSAAQSERTNWRLFDDYNARNVTAAFGELEWE